MYLEADEDLKDLREAKEASKNKECVPLNKVVEDLKLGEGLLLDVQR